ncbi:DsbA family oxidoreductase [Cognatishimia sp. WU-CL00825]|uniref:DsbA family oxidoreductase n=1 Tax=Cognatishimia sp. WU-CL00825 TaxID=3127658 RepID=UPI00310A30A9
MTLRIDIVSDIMCPWCIVGFKQLEQALTATKITAEIYWHPFELNPDMAASGQDLAEHLAEKYGSTPEQSAEVRGRLSSLGEDLGFVFKFNPESRIYNTFQAHQLLHWAGEHGVAHALKQALFEAYFSDGKDMSEIEVLVDEAGKVGLDRGEARAVLLENRYAHVVREMERFWQSRGITGVPAMIFDSKHLVTGAQGVENYIKILQRVLQESVPEKA